MLRNIKKCYFIIAKKCIIVIKKTNTAYINNLLCIRIFKIRKLISLYSCIYVAKPINYSFHLNERITVKAYNEDGTGQRSLLT